LSLGVGIVGNMDYDNIDNGTYVIDCEKLIITGRRNNYEGR